MVPLVDAELNRQFPGRELQKAQTPEGLREGWVAVQSAWQTTVAGTPPDLVDAHVEDEWSLAQSLRHLVLATDAWLRGGILRVQHPFHEIGQIFTGADEMGFDMSIFRVDPPVYEEILAVRAERQQLVTDFLATATTEQLAEERENPWGGGDWRPNVGDCIRVILEVGVGAPALHPTGSRSSTLSQIEPARASAKPLRGRRNCRTGDAVSRWRRIAPTLPAD